MTVGIVSKEEDASNLKFIWWGLDILKNHSAVFIPQQPILQNFYIYLKDVWSFLVAYYQYVFFVTCFMVPLQKKFTIYRNCWMFSKCISSMHDRDGNRIKFYNC